MSAISDEDRAGGMGQAHWVCIAAFGAMWLDLIRILSNTWETREQYSYGWFVPFLAAYSLWLRWLDRPNAGSLPPLWQTTAFGLAAMLLVPLRVMIEINSDWPLLAWILSIAVVGFSLHGVRLLGGWPWVRHLSFPIAFILVGVSWPYRIEKGLTQGLMKIVADITVELLGWVNIPAVPKGNLIEVSTGVVGVDEACSGIRSFQSTWMASLFMGELYRMTLVKRLFIVVAGLSMAFVFNIVRTFFLSWQASKNGLSAVDKWHDGAGLTILVISFIFLWLICGWLSKSKAGKAQTPARH